MTAAISIKPICGNCKYAVRSPTPGNVQCLYGPVQAQWIVTPHGPQKITYFPEPLEEWHCFRHERKTVQQQ